MHFGLLGLSHKTTSIEIREKFSLNENSAKDLANRLLQHPDIEEAMVLSTCNRLEVYLVAKNKAPAREALLHRLIDLGQTSLEEILPHLYEQESDQAIRHLFRVTAGLDSMIVGEPQIAGQVKDAYRYAIQAGAVGPYLSKVVEKSLFVAKKIRTETEIGRHPVSVSYAAVLLVEKIFGTLSAKKVLLVGLGEMGELTARHLSEREVRGLWLTNRTDEKSLECAERLKASWMPFVELEAELHQFDIVIVSTGAPDFVIKKTQVDRAMHERKNNPMLLIDIAVPRNIEPTVDQIGNVYLYDVDHLKGIVEANFKEREKEAKKAESMLIEEVGSFVNELEQRSISPTIQQLSKKLEQIRILEIEKHFKNIHLSEEERAIIEACTRSIINKVLHDPIISIKTESVKEGSSRYAEILKKLFKLEGESS